MRLVLNGLCWFSAAAFAWLAVMFVVLRHPGFERGFGMSLLYVLQSLLALAVVNDILSASAWRLTALVGAIGIIWAGGAALANTLSGPHFEGFALVIGTALVAQGLVTIEQLITSRFTSSSKVHQFGN